MDKLFKEKIVILFANVSFIYTLLLDGFTRYN